MLPNIVELACNGFNSAEAIRDQLGDPPSDKLIVLSLTPEAKTPSRGAVVEATKALATDTRAVFVAVHIPEVADGTDYFRSENTPIHQVVELTKDLGDELQPHWFVTLTNKSVWQLDSLFSLARNLDIPITIIRGTEPLSPDAQLFAWDFVTYYLLQEAKSSYGQHAIKYFEALQKELFHNQHSDPAKGKHFASDALLAPSLTEKSTNTKTSSNASPGEVLRLGSQLGMAHVLALRSIGKKHAIPKHFDSALLVGAYGGEHIGDIAILGGVLLRLNQNYGVTKAVLMTQRPNHTRHLVEQLHTPVSLTVSEYTVAEIDNYLPASDALVHAGGPLTDIPKQLTLHLYAAAKAKSMGKNYLMEGIGPTTFKRASSRITARQLVKLTDQIVVRTQQDVTSAVIQGANVKVSHDPAFDFLSTLGKELQVPPSEKDEIETLLSDTANRPVVGINIRPINDLFTPTKGNQDRLAQTRAIEDQMERNLAKGLAQFAEQCDVPPVFIFFPMNAIQFGKSDNRSAYRISRHLPPHMDARFWHSDASLEAVVSLIRRLDTVISMRFHATIFALSQNCMPIGIDYRIGMKYKVTAVMEDAGQAEFCCRIDQVDSQWIADKLHERISSKNRQTV